jgi:hypothetical protein
MHASRQHSSSQPPLASPPASMAYVCTDVTGRVTLLAPPQECLSVHHMLKLVPAPAIPLPKRQAARRQALSQVTSTPAPGRCSRRCSSANILPRSMPSLAGALGYPGAVASRCCSLFCTRWHVYHVCWRQVASDVREVCVGAGDGRSLADVLRAPDDVDGKADEARFIVRQYKRAEKVV